jgi:hypothetical protein
MLSHRSVSCLLGVGKLSPELMVIKLMRLSTSCSLASLLTHICLPHTNDCLSITSSWGLHQDSGTSCLEPLARIMSLFISYPASGTLV